jgi:hypothetical protein
MLPFKVCAQYGRGPEQVIADFKALDDAKSFIQDKLERDASHRVSVAYLLYDLGELMERFEPGQAESSNTGGQSQSSSNAARPSPLQTTLRPTGMPPSTFKDSDKGSDDKR